MKSCCSATHQHNNCWQLSAVGEIVDDNGHVTRNRQLINETLMKQKCEITF